MKIKGRWETRFIKYNEKLKKAKVIKRNRISLLNALFDLLNEAHSFRYEWIAYSVKNKIGGIND